MTALVMRELERVDGLPHGHPGGPEAALDGAVAARSEFDVGQPLQSDRRRPVVLRRSGKRLFDVAGDGGEGKLQQFAFQRCGIATHAGWPPWSWNR